METVGNSVFHPGGSRRSLFGCCRAAIWNTGARHELSVFCWIWLAGLGPDAFPKVNRFLDRLGHFLNNLFDVH